MADSPVQERYVGWFQEFLDAPTDRLPGYFGDWLDVDCRIEETEDSITLSGRENLKGPYTKEVTLYGSQTMRRVQLVRWLYETCVVQTLASIVEKHPQFREDAWLFAELPIRLTFNPDYANRLLGKEWS